MAVDVAREHRREPGGDRAPGDHVEPGTEDEPRRADSGPLERLVRAQQTHVARPGGGSREQVRERRRDTVALAREAGDDDRHAAHVEDEGARAVEDVQVGVRRQQGIRQTRPFVIARHQQHRHAAIGDRQQRLQRRRRQAARDPTAEQEVAAVHNEVDVAATRGREGEVEVGEEVGAAPRARDPRPLGQVEAEVGVRNEQDAQHAGVLPTGGDRRSLGACEGTLHEL